MNREVFTVWWCTNGECKSFEAPLASKKGNLPAFEDEWGKRVAFDNCEVCGDKLHHSDVIEIANQEIEADIDQI